MQKMTMKTLKNAIAALAFLTLTVGSAFAQGNVIPPNGTHSDEVTDLEVQTVAGPVSWSRIFNGSGWRFNRQWDGISASFKPVMTQNSGGGSASMLSGGETSVCWIWVDEDWKPGTLASEQGGTNATVSLSADSYIPANNSYNQTSVPLESVLGTAFSSGCASMGGSMSGGATGGGSEVLEGFRRMSTLYVGSNGTYIFKNRYVLKKQAIQELAAYVGEPQGGPVSLGSLENVPNGWRWSDRGGDWSEYDDGGRMTRYGDKNNNIVWIQRNTAGRIVRLIASEAGATTGEVAITLHYNSAGFLLQAKDYPQADNALDLPQRTVSYGYDAFGRMTSVTDVRAQITRYDYDTKARLTVTTDPLGRQTKLTYEEQNNSVKQMTAADGGVSDFSFGYDDAKKVFYSKFQGPVSPAGRRVEDFTHDRAGDLVRYELNGKTEVEIKRDPVGRTETRTNSRGFATVFTKNEYEQVTQVQNPDGTKQTTVYEARMLNPVEDTDETGAKFRYEYDAKGNQIRDIAGLGSSDERITEYELNAAGRAVKVTRKGRNEINGTVTPDAVWQLSYDASGQLSQTTDPEGKQRSYVYDRVGSLVKFTDPRGKVWLSTYDAAGNVLTLTDPLGLKNSYTYDDNGNTLTQTDPRGKVYALTYDVKDRLTKRTDAAGGQYVVSYNQQNQISSVTDASGKSMRMDYDALNRLTKATDSKNQAFGIEYTDADGTDRHAVRPSKVRYPTMDRLFRFNEREFVSLKSEIDGSEGRTENYGYDGAGRRTTFTDPNGKTRYYEYTPHGEVSQVKDPLGNVMRMLHDARGNTIEVIDPNSKSTKMAYDRRNLLIKTTDPLGAFTEYNYDDIGRLMEIKQANGQKVVYTYDDSGRISQQRDYDAQVLLKNTIGYSYDAAGNMLTWSDDQYASVRTYDNADRLSSEVVSYGRGSTTFSLSHAYTYHGNGQIKSYTGPDGLTIGYEYDGSAQLERLSIPGEGNIAVTEWQWFQPKKVLLPGGSEQRMEYDGYQSLTRMKVVNPAQATLFELQNQFGKLDEVKQANVDGNTLNYQYDDAGRLQGVVASALSGRSETFGLDAASNRVTHSRTGTGQWVYDAANQLKQRPAANGSGVISYDYDASGNMVRKTDTSLSGPAQVTNYAWDALNRLAEVTDGTSTSIASYSYDPFDRRIKKVLGNSTTLQATSLSAGSVTYYLQSEWGVLAESSAAGVVQASYGWSPQRDAGVAPLFARVPDPAAAGQYRYVYFHNDHMGVPQRATDKAGNLVWAADYDAYGKATVKTTANPSLALTNNLRLPGQYFDAETGLHYNDRRYYDPNSGRYVSRDPIGFEGGINLYTYAGASPSRFVDPTGEVVVPLACMAANYLRCFATCVATDLAKNFFFDCNKDPLDIAKDCGLSCLLSMLPVPDPCGKFGKLFSATVGLAGAAPDFSNSFASDVMVHMRPDGAADSDAKQGRAKLRPIKELKVGDQVLALSEWKENINSKAEEAEPDVRLSYEKVTHLVTSYREQQIVRIKLNSGSVIETTAGHPFRTINGWRDAVLLREGGKLLLKSTLGDARTGNTESNNETVATISDVSFETKIIPVFNIEVANAHTFFVGVDGALVHNGGRGMKYAGLNHPTTGVAIDKNGFPDFADWIKNSVKIKCSGNRKTDNRRANAKAGYKSTPDDHVWHHHQDGETMQLVPKDIHGKTGHNGGFKETKR
jgi:RHS repeat-associated protein